MKLIQKTFVCDASIDDPSVMCGQLAVGIWVVEAGYSPVPAHNPCCVPAWRALAAGVALSVSSRTALRLGLGPALVDWLSQQDRCLGPLAGLALHELIVNAAIHGNLGAASSKMDRWSDLNAYQATIAASLEDSECCSRLVTVALGWASDRVVAIISDEGSGYEASDPLGCNRASGRGLRIARAVGDVDILSGGRQIALTLDCPMPEAGR